MTCDDAKGNVKNSIFIDREIFFKCLLNISQLACYLAEASSFEFGIMWWDLLASIHNFLRSAPV